MTDLTTTVFDLLLILIVALVPAIGYLAWIRSIERYRTVAWSPLLSAFLYGAIFATLVAATVEAVLLNAGTALSQAYPAPEFTFLNGNSTAGQFFLILVIAPFVEEGLKATGVLAQRSRIQYVADGPVYGASVGLGFGFLETVLYGIVGWGVGGLTGAITIVLVRSVSSVLLHASSTAMFGYGYARSKLLGDRGATGRYYLVAVGMHSSYNALASVGVILVALGVSNSIGNLASGLGLVAAITFAFVAIEYIARLVRLADFPAADPHHPMRYRPPGRPPTRS
ncbi:MAG: PrsW family intramembrane metalloprotease [Thermoplasmata archaeon]